MAVLLKSFDSAFERLLESIDNWRDRDDAEMAIGREQKATRAYKINCTGDIVKGDKIMFIKRVWDRVSINRFGKMANVVVDYELVEGEVVRESYGASRGQHTFTIGTACDEFKIKGRNLYAVGCWRKQWPDESKRGEVADEKHARGGAVRRAKRQRYS